MKEVLKLLDELALPAIFLVSARYLGVFSSQLVFSTSFSIGKETDFWSLPFIHFAGPNGQFTANSLSWTFVAVVVIFYFGLVIFRVLHFHEDHIHPKQSWSIHNKKVNFMIIGQRDVFYQMLAWMILLLFAILLISIDLFSGRLSTAVWGLFFGGSSVLLLTSVFNLRSKEMLENRKVK